MVLILCSTKEKIHFFDSPDIVCINKISSYIVCINKISSYIGCINKISSYRAQIKVPPQGCGALIVNIQIRSAALIRQRPLLQYFW